MRMNTPAEVRHSLAGMNLVTLFGNIMTALTVEAGQGVLDEADPLLC